MMTLDEAIEHAQEKAAGCSNCAEEHRQLVAWLIALRQAKRASKRLEATLHGLAVAHEELAELSCEDEDEARRCRDNAIKCHREAEKIKGWRSGF